jgi:hypothetical protein
MKIHAVLSLFFVASLQTGRASEFSTGFGTEYNHAGEVSGQNDWTISDPTPDLSFFVRLNGSDAAALGGFYDVPTGSSATLSHPVEMPLTGSSFHVSLAILSSTNLFPGRDTFGWSFADSAGEKLFTLRFIPSANDPNLLSIAWFAGEETPVLTGGAIAYAAPYAVDVKFTSAGSSDPGFTATITGTNSYSFSGSLPGLAGKKLASVGAEFIISGTVPGDNFMIFDNVKAMTLPPVDADGDGFSAEMEAWFGTSDTDGYSSPAPVLSFAGDAASLTFPSVAGNTYLVESSDDLVNWSSVPVTALDSTTTWLDPGSGAGCRFFRVTRP